jgi:polysaccharide pyruvyl transferase WcaK-like protein
MGNSAGQATNRPLAQAALVGAVGTNLGDEAIALAICDYLAPSIRMQVGSILPDVSRRLYPNLSWFSLERKTIRDWKNILSVFRSSRAVAMGGGTLVQDALGISTLHGMLPRLLQFTLAARLAGRKVAWASVGVDPVRTSLGRRYLRALAKRTSLFVVRDGPSRSRLLEYAHTQRPVIVGADPAFLLTPPPTRPRDQPYVVISAVRENLDFEASAQGLAQLVQAIVREGLDCILLPMDRSPSEESSLYARTMKLLDHETARRVEQIAPGITVAVAHQLLAHAECVVAMRLHAAILAAGHSPVVGISRAAKSDTLFSSFQMPFVSAQSWNPKEVLSLVKDQLRRRNEILLHHQVLRTRLAGEAREGLNALRGFLLAAA